jgi:hypothetical protein
MALSLGIVWVLAEFGDAAIQDRSRIASRKRRASGSCSKPRMMSSAAFLVFTRLAN